MIGDVSGDIFDYKQLVAKLDREIERLSAAEMACNEHEAIDHALNAAFTGYHLLEWEDKYKNPVSGDRIKARDLLKRKNSPNLNLLHDIVTRAKHVTIGESAYHKPINVRVSASVVSTVTSNRQTIQNRKIVKFDNESAYEILVNVLKLFKELLTSP